MDKTRGVVGRECVGTSFPHFLMFGFTMRLKLFQNGCFFGSVPTPYLSALHFWTSRRLTHNWSQVDWNVVFIISNNHCGGSYLWKNFGCQSQEGATFFLLVRLVFSRYVFCQFSHRCGIWVW